MSLADDIFKGYAEVTTPPGREALLAPVLLMLHAAGHFGLDLGGARPIQRSVAGCVSPLRQPTSEFFQILK